MDPEIHKILRAPFQPDQIGKLPKISCRNCSQTQGKVCDRHAKSRCTVCGNWITNAHIDVDYVGHAAVTDRLLKADPSWSWAPAYRDVDPHVLASAAASGDPAVVQMILDNSPARFDGPGMWIKLTVAGVTRLGFGTDDSRGENHDKILIGDAIRNAAMRFGVGLDLWSKEDLGGDDPAPAADPPATGGRNWVAEADACTEMDVLLRIGRECNDAGQYEGVARAALLRRRRELTPTNPPAAPSPASLLPTSVSVHGNRLARTADQNNVHERTNS